jgi:diadenosine tetraphosphatase ApaH/serine/threonine PP2A family protein phosphatase
MSNKHFAWVLDWLPLNGTYHVDVFGCPGQGPWNEHGRYTSRLDALAALNRLSFAGHMARLLYEDEQGSYQWVLSKRPLRCHRSPLLPEREQCA